MSSPLSRRRFAALAGGAATGALAGCLDSLTGGTDAPEPSGEAVDHLPRPVRGDPEADVTVAAFVDFSCPHCQTYEREFVPSLVEEYVEPGRIRYEHWDFPIPVDEYWSWRAASAARAVQDEVGDEAFFSFVELVFEHQGDYSLELMGQLAGEVDAPPSAVRTAAEDATYVPVITEDRQSGEDSGVEATPTVLVNGEIVDDLSYQRLAATIEGAEGG